MFADRPGWTSGVSAGPSLVLYHLMDRSFADIATETGANLSTVKTRLTRGRAALAVLLTVDTATNAGGAHVHGA